MANQQDVSTLRSAMFIAAGLLAAAVIWTFPYGFYTILRIVVTGVGAWAAWSYFERKRTNIGLLFAAIAVLFNPVIKISFERSEWRVIDAIAAIAFAACATTLQTMSLTSNAKKPVPGERADD